LHCLGTSYIFSLKAKTYKTRIRIITILGVVVPILIGATATTYGQSSTVLTIAISITALLAILQAVLSAISLVNK
jgi:mobilome CxxCx(11)CxxC protein